MSTSDIKEAGERSTLALEGKERIKQIVCEILEIDPDEVTDVSLFKEDHQADSLRAIEILAMLEREFHIEIQQSELTRMVNLDGVYQVVAEHVGASR